MLFGPRFDHFDDLGVRNQVASSFVFKALFDSLEIKKIVDRVFNRGIVTQFMVESSQDAALSFQCLHAISHCCLFYALAGHFYEVA